MPNLPSIRAIVAAFVITAVLGLPAAAQAAGSQAAGSQAADTDVAVRWSILPSEGEGEPFEFELDPGESVSDSVVVTNLSEDTLNLLLTSVDVLNDDTGALSFAFPNETPIASGLWITPSGDTVTLAPGGSAEVSFSLAVPDDATPGDYLAGLAVLDLDDDAAGAEPAVSLGTGVLTSVTVAGVREPGVEVGAVASSYAASVNPFSPGTLTIEYDVANTGNTLIDLQQSIEVTGPLGIVLAEVTPERVVDLLPDQAVRTRVDVPGIPPLLLTWAGVNVVSLEPGTETEADAANGVPVDGEPVASGDVATQDAADPPAPDSTDPAPSAAAPAPLPGSTDGPIVAETVDAYSIVYPDDSSSSVAATISWTLLLLLLIPVIAIAVAVRLASGTRARNYLIIDELLAERAAESGGQRGGAA